MHMDRLHQYLTLTTDMGMILRYISAGTCIPLIVALIFREFDMLIPMATVPVILFCIGTLLIRLPETEREPRLSMSLFSVAAIWLLWVRFRLSSVPVCPTSTASLRQCPGGRIPG